MNADCKDITITSVFINYHFWWLRYLCICISPVKMDADFPRCRAHPLGRVVQQILLTLISHLLNKATYIKNVCIYHCWLDPKRWPVMLNGCLLEKAPYPERILVLKLTPDFKWNSYIQPTAKDAGKWSVPCTASVPHAILYLYKS